MIIVLLQYVFVRSHQNSRANEQKHMKEEQLSKYIRPFFSSSSNQLGPYKNLVGAG